MNKIYFLRHQANGVVHEFPFAEPPTEAQMKAVMRLCFMRHGGSHKKTPDEPFWTRVVEVELLGPNDIPDVPERVLTGVSVPGVGKADTNEVSASGTGHVEVPADK